MSNLALLASSRKRALDIEIDYRYELAMRVLNSSTTPSAEPSAPGICPLRSIARFTASVVTGTVRGIRRTFTPRSHWQSDADSALATPASMCTGEEDNAARIARKARAHRPLLQPREKGFGEPNGQIIEHVEGIDAAVAMGFEFGQEYGYETPSPWVRGYVRAAMAIPRSSPRSCEIRAGKDEDDLSEEEEQLRLSDAFARRCVRLAANPSAEQEEDEAGVDAMNRWLSSQALQMEQLGTGLKTMWAGSVNDTQDTRETYENGASSRIEKSTDTEEDERERRSNRFEDWDEYHSM